MGTHGVIWYLAAGLLIGWLASLMVQGRGMGLVRDLGIGIAGGIIGMMLIEAFGIPNENFVTFFCISLCGGILFLMGLKILTPHKSRGAKVHSR